MKICMVLHDPQEFGGLEEYATTLAIGLKRQGQDVSVLSTVWVSRNNQYIKRLIANDVKYVQTPKWLSRPASHWATKVRFLNVILFLLSPLIFILTFGLVIFTKVTWQQAWKSARGWLGKIFFRLLGPNRYKPLFVLLLGWWRLYWHPDLFHLQGYTSNLLFVIDWAYRKKIPVVYEEHQTPDAQFDWWKSFNQSINKATTVIAVSETSADALRVVCDVARPIIVRKPLLPDPLPSGWNGKNGSNNPNQVIRVTTVARLGVAKGLEYLLEAIALVRDTHPDVVFRVYGDGPLRQDLLDQAFKLGLDGNSIFVGPFKSRDELSAIMADTEMFVMSSILEGQPLSVVEAMAYGLPIVTTSVGGIPELIQDGVNGLLCSPRDPECLAKKIKKLIDNPSLREKLGKAARQSYEKSPFQPKSVSEHFISIYQDALRDGTPA